MAKQYGKVTEIQFTIKYYESQEPGAVAVDKKVVTVPESDVEKMAAIILAEKTDAGPLGHQNAVCSAAFRAKVTQEFKESSLPQVISPPVSDAVKQSAKENESTLVIIYKNEEIYGSCLLELHPISWQ